MNKTYLAIGASIVSAGVGFYAGWLVAESKLNKLYNEQMEAEIARTKQFYMASTKPGSPADVAEALGLDIEVTGGSDGEVVAAAADSIRKFSGKQVTIVRDGAIVEGDGESFDGMEDEEDEALEASLIAQNLFEDVPEENIDTSGRTPDRPYQITSLEFAENETGYDQVSVTWYSEDNVLTSSDDDSLVDDHKCVGDHNLELFGTGQDPNIVHVRNDRLKVDYEVARHQGKFAHAVHGFTHSDETYERRRRPRRSADE